MPRRLLVAAIGAAIFCGAAIGALIALAVDRLDDAHQALGDTR